MLRIDARKLQTLLDQTLSYRGLSCRVIEILTDEPALVLRDRQDHKVIQANQYGEAGPRVPRTFTVTLLDSQGDGFNPDLPELATFDLLL
ncbi:MAG: hypothetical protein IPP10_08755 [Candidatus Competibacteraceae bacterium]|nr:hypothetical protein [Candidatus Competibacteraceae bacterium]MBK7982882.1 hypothetical protein [Candidatus Competibacteraceae bacterium]MBK8898571.1 hypothetical protein [Candidatus Competibacteraceae bacterium]MBK8962375.1 hypothetical protein [Candidatus Competibacteraceae bacterium]MBK9951590.1 hypothetical protein [Candidatus Competibacteraceae bacterium]